MSLVVSSCGSVVAVRMRAALAAVEGVADHCTVVLGEMRELGPGTADLHAEVGAEGARLRPRWFFAVGAHAADYARGAIAAGMAGEAVTAGATHIRRRPTA